MTPAQSRKNMLRSMRDVSLPESNAVAIDRLHSGIDGRSLGLQSGQASAPSCRHQDRPDPALIVSYA